MSGPEDRSRPFAEGVGPGLIYLAFRAAAFLAERLPLSVGNAAARAGGRIAYRLARGKRAIVRKNMARVVGDGPHVERVVRAAFDSYARYWLETFRLGRYSRDEILEMVTCDSVEVLREAIGSGRGVVIATAHFGFYDLGVAWVGAMGFPLHTVAEVLKPRALFEWFARTRAHRGIPVIPAKPRDQAIERQMQLLGRGEGVALLSERSLSRRGVWVEFFGERTTFPVGPPMLVARSGAALLMGAIYQQGDKFRVHFEPLEVELSGDEGKDIGAVAQVIARAVERMVSLAPEQWHLFVTNWPSDEPHLEPRGSSRAVG